MATRIDELEVQLDLAKMEGRQVVRARMEGLENAYLAARSRLSSARGELGANVSSVREGVEALLRDLQQAYEDAVEALRRGRNEPNG